MFDFAHKILKKKLKFFCLNNFQNSNEKKCFLSYSERGRKKGKRKKRKVGRICPGNYLII